MRTVSGRRVNLSNFKADDINLSDIATALSNICRFNGHVIRRLSVAQHCMIGSILADTDDLKREALLHDAAEAYTGDIILPVKETAPEVEILEDSIAGVIFDTLWPGNNLTRWTGYVKSEEMKVLDWRLAVNEDRFLRPSHHDPLEYAEDEWLEAYLKVHTWGFNGDTAKAYEARVAELLQKDN